jgi:riboflavin synthase alpha subunit
MFSGIVEEMATVVAIRKEQGNMDFTLSCSFVDELKIDQSIAHNGVCLTVVSIQDGTYTVTAMKETLDRSNLGLLEIGDHVKHRTVNAYEWTAGWPYRTRTRGSDSSVYKNGRRRRKHLFHL